VADGPAAAGLLARHLRRRDDSVIARPEEALELLRRGSRFDAIVADILMTSMSAEAFHAAVAKLAPEQAERMVLIPALPAPQDRATVEPVEELDARDIARRKLLKTAVYVTPALLATFVARPAQAQKQSCMPSQCRPHLGCNPHPP
jgi:CheY-like chemotaxis protein